MNEKWYLSQNEKIRHEKRRSVKSGVLFMMNFSMLSASSRKTTPSRSCQSILEPFTGWPASKICFHRFLAKIKKPKFENSSFNSKRFGFWDFLAEWFVLPCF